MCILSKEAVVRLSSHGFVLRNVFAMEIAVIFYSISAIIIFALS